MIIVDRRCNEPYSKIAKVQGREDFGGAFLHIHLEEGYFIELDKAEVEEIIKVWKGKK